LLPSTASLFAARRVNAGADPRRSRGPLDPRERLIEDVVDGGVDAGRPAQRDAQIGWTDVQAVDAGGGSDRLNVLDRAPRLDHDVAPQPGVDLGQVGADADRR